MSLSQLIQELNFNLKKGPPQSGDKVEIPSERPLECGAPRLEVVVGGQTPSEVFARDLFQLSDASGSAQSIPARLGLEKLFGAPPAIQASVSADRSSISFGDVTMNSSTSQYFSIRNDSDCSVTVYLSGPSSPFSLSSSSSTISGHSSQSFSVTFSPSSTPQDQYYSSYISINPSGNSISLSGRGVRR